MNFQTFLHVFTAALYNETELSGKREFTVGEVLDKYSLTWKPLWEENFIEEIERQGLARVDGHIGRARKQHISISANGINWVELNLGENVASYLEQNGAHYQDSDGAPIDSAAWTGLPSTFVLAEEKRETLVSMLREAESSLDQLGAGNSEKAMARAYIVAARTLADAPDPPVDLIWEIIGRANSLAGIASLLVSIIALFSAATH